MFFKSWQGKEIFLLSEVLTGSAVHSASYLMYREVFSRLSSSWCVNMIVYLHLEPRLRTIRTLPSLPRAALWRSFQLSIRTAVQCVCCSSIKDKHETSYCIINLINLMNNSRKMKANFVTQLKCIWQSLVSFRLTLSRLIPCVVYCW
jgi:hypothetical protein